MGSAEASGHSAKQQLLDLMRQEKSSLTLSQRREHSDTRIAFVRLDGEKRRHLVERDILFSLKFPQIHDRFDRIARAHKNTFTWVFRDPQAYHKPWDNSLQWTFYDSSIYWVQSRAASGKSTLMRYIWNRGLTTLALRTWSSGSQLTVSSFFFENGGISEQRTQIGLLRSLLYHVAIKPAADTLVLAVSNLALDGCSFVTCITQPYLSLVYHFHVFESILYWL